MTKPTPDQIRDFLDDLARISLRHGLVVEGNTDGAAIAIPDGDFDGYSCQVHPDPGADCLLMSPRRFDAPHMTEWNHNSIDLTQLSNHERLMIMGGRV